MRDIAKPLQLQTRFEDRFTLLSGIKRVVAQRTVQVRHGLTLEFRIYPQGIGSKLGEQGGIDLARGRFDSQAALVTLHRLFRARAEVAVPGDVPVPTVLHAKRCEDRKSVVSGK